MWDDVGAAIGLMLVFEGILYAVFADRMDKMVALLATAPPHFVRVVGLMAAAAGVLVVWLVRG